MCRFPSGTRSSAAHWFKDRVDNIVPPLKDALSLPRLVLDATAPFRDSLRLFVSYYSACSANLSVYELSVVL